MYDRTKKEANLESIEIDAFDLLDRKMGNKALEQLHKRICSK